ncbi:MAG: nucleoside triphosphate pyrophosphohydrolase [Clostridia bacterium]|nr:nucleoside triphosphate pyrophosphohydrolase [Clostridia bacterium]
MALSDNIHGSYQHYIPADFTPTFVLVNKRIPCLVKVEDRADCEGVKNKVVSCYGKDKSVAFSLDGVEGKTTAENLAIFDEIYLEKEVDLKDRKRFDLGDLEEIMKRLRADDGCEWDKIQTHNSIRINLIEEAYELLEGLDNNDRDMMLEECGDVLLQAVFHTQIAEDEGDFNWTDMLTALCRKLLDRHTHIFGENHADTPEEALVFWTEAKKKEKKYTSNTDAMSRVPKNFPALLYAEKVQKIAKKCGFDWDTVDGAVDKVKEELDELLSASPEDRHEEAGDLLFAVCNVLRFYKIDNEMALHDANRKFVERFKVVEELATRDGKEMTDYTLQQLDEFWNEAKRQGK